MRRLIAVPAIIVALALVAAGCGDDGGNADASAEATTSTAARSTTTTTTTTAPLPAVPTPAASTLEELFALGRPVVIGHAGGDQSWPHSTMFAFREAALAGTDVLEMDVQLTGDGVLVVQHDDTVDRTTQTSGRVRDYTYDELQALDNGYWWSDDWSNRDLPAEAYVYRGVRTGEIDPPEGYTPDDFRVETFRAVAEAFPDHLLDIEIKVPRGDDGENDLEFAIEGARVLAEEIDALERTESVVVVSYDDDVMAAFHQLAPDVVTSPGNDAMRAWFLEDEVLLPSHAILQVPPVDDGLDVLNLPGFLDKAEEDGLGIWVWPNDASTQENPDFYESLLAYGIDGIIAGHPEQAVARYRELGVIPAA